MTATYREVMDSYPKCACGHGLWAALSRERGRCEACEIAARRRVGEAV
jgi:hypothetical protein